MLCFGQLWRCLGKGRLESNLPLVLVLPSAPSVAVGCGADTEICNKMRRLLLACCALSAHGQAVEDSAHQEYRCVHDEIEQRSGGVDDSGYFFSPQQYASEMAPGRRRLQSLSYSPIRVEIRYVDTSALTSSLQTFLTGTLVPWAKAWIESALRVVPVSGSLRAARTCSASFSSGTCHSEGTTTCGTNGDQSSYSIPSDLLDSLTYCSSCTVSGSCSGCTTSPQGAGATSADYVLFVSAVTTASCSGGTLAYAGTCQRDQYDRPIFGCDPPSTPRPHSLPAPHGRPGAACHGTAGPTAIPAAQPSPPTTPSHAPSTTLSHTPLLAPRSHANFCPASLSAAAADLDGQRATAVHELLHALGFSSGSWPYALHLT
jgi:hypothetical protein